MKLDLKSFKLLNEGNPWQVDFRDSALANDATFNAIRVYIIYGLAATTLLFGLLCVFSFFEKLSKQGDYERQKGFIAQHSAKTKQMVASNQTFVQRKNELLGIIQGYTSPFGILEFFSELAAHKGENLRFSNITIKDNKDVSANSTRQPIEIQLYGKLKDDVTFLDQYKEEVLNFASLKTIEKGCKGFLQITNNNGSASDEINFQLTIQSNE